MHRYLPSPPASAVHLSFLTIHFYAVAILCGIAIALFLTKRRFHPDGDQSDDIYEIAARVIPAGIVGGRVYHVITSPDNYFGRGGKPLDAFKIWEGGMGIWGAVGLGAAAAWSYFYTRGRRGEFPIFADALVPGLLLAQAIGRWGNWFNNELFGGPTTLPWALKVPAEFRPTGYESFATFHPTFLYESLWCVLGAILVLKARRLVPILGNLRKGSLFLTYIVYYCFGRLICEWLRIDPAHHIAGLRVNIWVCLMGIGVGSYFLLRREKSPR